MIKSTSYFSLSISSQVKFGLLCCNVLDKNSNVGEERKDKKHKVDIWAELVEDKK